MSLTLLPAVDVRNGKAVRLTKGESGTETEYGTPMEAAEKWISQGAEWIHLVDLDAAFGTGNNRELINGMVSKLSGKVKFEVSGGMRDDESIERALEAGATRVNIGTRALEDPVWTADAVAKWGDKVAISLDVRGHQLAARGWTQESGDLLEMMKYLDKCGAQRYVVTDVTKDGTMEGPNLDLIQEVAENTTGAKVTVSGGIATLDDIKAIAALQGIGVDSAILGKALYNGNFTLAEALEAAK